MHIPIAINEREPGPKSSAEVFSAVIHRFFYWLYLDSAFRAAIGTPRNGTRKPTRRKVIRSVCLLNKL